MEIHEIKSVLEAVLFASEAPVATDRLAELFRDESVARADIVAAVSELREEYEKRGGGFSLQEVAGGYQFRTRTELAPWIKRLKSTKPAPMSPAALETLAVIAYRQPVVKSEIDAVRGVDGGGVLRSLLDRKLVRIVGRKDVPGKPILYGTTKRFLEVFNLKDLSELPTLRELKSQLAPDGEQ